MSVSTSIIILAFNGMDHIPECTESIYAQTDQDFELIVVDNASTDSTCQWLTEHCPDAHLIRSKRNLGYCGGMNLGIKHAKGKYVFLLNQDTILDPDCIGILNNHLDTQESNTIGAFPMVMFNHAKDFINSFGVNWYESCHWRDTRVGLVNTGQFLTPEPVLGSIFPAVMFRRKEFMKLGAFDRMFWSYCEDFDVSYRCNIFGYELHCVPGSKLFHKYRASSKDTSDPLWSHYWFVRNYLLVFLKNYQLKNLVKYRRIIYLRYMGFSLRNALNSRNYPEIRMYLKIIGSLFLNLPRILFRRWQISRKRIKDDVEIWKSGKVEEFNIYHVDGNIVLSLNAMRAACDNEEYTYNISGQNYSSI